MRERQDSNPVNPVEEVAEVGTHECASCDGMGKEYGETCMRCGGSGVLKPCPTCGGKGYPQDPVTGRGVKCKDCRGAGDVPVEDEIYEGETRDMAKDKLRRRNATTPRDREKGQEYKALNKDLKAAKGDPKEIERTRMKMNAKFPAHKDSNRTRADNARK